MQKPIVAITMGDAAGIGPELVVKVLAQQWVWELCNPLVVGDPGVLADIGRVVGADLRFRVVADVADARFTPPDVDVLCPEGVLIDQAFRGQVDPAMGKAAVRCLQQAYELAMPGEIQGVVSAPLNKEAFHLAGYQYSDELAYLADITDSPEPFMVGAMGAILTVAVTEHIPFREIVDFIKRDRILWYIAKMHAALQQVSLAEARIAVAALNVHAGEGGLFGREEIDEIEPAIHMARDQGINAHGPVPADTVFARALAGEFDGVVCMYHDQANIARKLQPRDKSATLFLGLPVVCGTTAHGTAFDKAGQGIADPGSLETALKYTARLASP